MLCKKLKNYSVFMVLLSQEKKRMKTKNVRVQNNGKQRKQRKKQKQQTAMTSNFPGCHNKP